MLIKLFILKSLLKLTPKVQKVEWWRGKNAHTHLNKKFFQLFSRFFRCSYWMGVCVWMCASGTMCMYVGVKVVCCVCLCIFANGKLYVRWGSNFSFVHCNCELQLSLKSQILCFAITIFSDLYSFQYFASGFQHYKKKIIESMRN